MNQDVKMDSTKPPTQSPLWAALVDLDTYLYEREELEKASTNPTETDIVAEEMKKCKITNYDNENTDNYNSQKTINENQVIFTDRAWNELSNFEYMPIRFKNLVTSELAFATSDEGDRSQHPFFKLFEIASDAKEVVEDRFQAVRYMAHIPHQKQIVTTIEACCNIVFDDSIDIYKRYHFFSTNQKYFKLPSWLVHVVHKEFFFNGIELKYPFDILSLSARYVLGKYPSDSLERQDCLEWLLDIIDDLNEHQRVRAEAADVLVCCGDWDEQEFGKKVLDELGGKGESIYENTENVHHISNDSVRDVIRALRSKFNINDFQVEMAQSMIEEFIQSPEEKELTLKFFYRVMTDPTKIDRLNLVEILGLVHSQIMSMDESIQFQLRQRLYEEAKDAADTCTTGYVNRILNVLSGFVEGRSLELRLSPKDELRSAIFARLNKELRELTPYQQEQVLDSISSENKTAVEEFLLFFGPEDDLWEEYNNILSKAEFDVILNECYKQYQGL